MSNPTALHVGIYDRAMARFANPRHLPLFGNLVQFGAVIVTQLKHAGATAECADCPGTWNLKRSTAKPEGHAFRTGHHVTITTRQTFIIKR